MSIVREKFISQQNILPLGAVKTSEAVGHETAAHAHQHKVIIYKTYQTIWYILGVIEAFLAFRVILKLIAANPLNPFAALVYDLSHPFANPFFGLVINPTAPNGFVFEWSTIIGMLVYVAVTYGLVYLLKLIVTISTSEAESQADEVEQID